jgi:hypothetical protein
MSIGPISDWFQPFHRQLYSSTDGSSRIMEPSVKSITPTNQRHLLQSLYIIHSTLAVDNRLPESILLNEMDWITIREVHKLLKPFKDAQELLEGDKYVTLSLFYQLLSKPSELP